MAGAETNTGMGDVIVLRCDIISNEGKHLMDMSKNAWNGITITESMGLRNIDLKFISGEIFIKDGIDIFNQMSIVGGEVVDLAFKLPGEAFEPIEFLGKVYAVDLHKPPSSNYNSIVVKFCSPEKLISDQMKLNRSYRNLSYSTMILDVISTLNAVSGKKAYVEPTKNLGSMIVNNEDPVRAINRISAVCRSSRYDGANYLFFESLNNTFRCQSLESIVDPYLNDPAITYTLEETPSADVKNLAAVKSFRIIKLPNMAEGISGGMYASTLVSNDLMKRKVSFRSFDYLNSYEKYKSVNYSSVPTYGQGITALTNNKNFRNTSHYQFNPKNFLSLDTEVNYQDEFSDMSLIRRSQLYQMSSIQIEISVSGDSDRRVGDIVDLVIPSSMRGGYQDEILSGRYVVAKAKHMISSVRSNGYRTVLLLVKDSYSLPLPESVS